MKKEQFYKITDYIAGLISDTEFALHTYAVGGSVRDLVMGNDIKDIDLVIDLPNGGVNLANYIDKLGECGNVVIYPKYGTAMFKLNAFPEEEIECVMTRGEKYIDKDTRNPVCVFSTLDDDARRRDLTMNALYYNLTTKEIFDPTGGLNDIKNTNLVKTTNPDPDTVFDDDPLRILRVVRFATKYGRDIEENTFKSMVKFVDRLEIISKERIQSEFNKIITCKNAVKGIGTLVNIGAMKYIIPELEETVGLEQNHYHFGDVYQHTIALLDYYHKNFEVSNSVTVALALLLHDIGKIKTQTVKDGKVHFYNHEFVGAGMVEPILRKLKYDLDTINDVKFLVKNHMRTKNAGDGLKNIKDKTFNKLAHDCGCEKRYLMLAIVIECDNMSHKSEHCIYGQKDAFVERLGDAHRMMSYKLPVNGDDVMTELGIKPGIDVKKVLHSLMKLAYNNPNITKPMCLKQIHFVYKQMKQGKK